MVVFFDIDGTIIDEKTQEIPASAVARLAENGHMPVINTGRPYSHIDPRVKAMAFRGYVCGCGMEVRLGDRWLYRKKPDSALCAYVAEAVRKFDILPLYEGDDGTVMYEPDCWELPFIREELDRMRKKGFRVYPRQEHPDFMKFISFSRSETAQQGFCQAMAPYFEIIDRGGNHFTEYVLKGCSKAGGLLALLEALGVPKRETLAIGDSTNDLPMFRAAAHTVCLGGGMEEVIVGVVGTLQFDVLEYRLKNEYNVDLYMEGLPYEYLRWIRTDDGENVKEEDLILGTDVKLVEDYKGNQLLLFGSQWAINWTAERNPNLTFSEFGGGAV